MTRAGVLILSVIASIWPQKLLTWRNPLPQGNGLNALDFPDRQRGIAVGQFGTILRTENGGNTWSPSANVNLANLWDVDLVDGETGYAVGEGGTVVKTRDGGRSWMRLNTPTTRTLMHAHFFSADTGFISGDGGVILRTRDGGLSWKADSAHFGSLYGMEFVDRKSGIIVGAQAKGLVLVTGDGGDTWTNLDYEAGSLRAIGNGIAIGRNGLMIDLSGKTHPSLSIIDDLVSIRFLDSKQGCITGDRTVSVTSDGGKTWRTKNLGAHYALKDARMLDSMNIVAVGDVGMILRSRDGGESWESPPNGLYANIQSMQVFNRDTAVAFSYGPFTSGAFMRTTDGWKTWKSIKPWGGNVSPDFHFASSLVGYLAGDSLQKTEDGGNTWSPLEWKVKDAIVFHPSNLRFLDEQTGFMSDNDQNAESWIGKTDDGGKTWRVVLRTGSGNAIQGFVFPTPTLGFANNNGRIFKSTDAGESWSLAYSIPESVWGDMQFFNDKVGYLSGWERVFKTTDGGQTWNPLEVGLTGENIRSLSFHNPDTGYLALNKADTRGSSGRVLMTRDGGKTWSQPHAGLTQPLNVVRVAPTGEVFAAGDGGTLIELSDGNDPISIWISRPKDGHDGLPRTGVPVWGIDPLMRNGTDVLGRTFRSR